jgi:hypothetical protein
MFEDGSVRVYGGLLKGTDRWGSFKRIMRTGTTVADGDLYLMRAII